MNGNVTQRASLIFLRLVMKSWCRRRSGIDRQRMALQAHQVHLAALQQARIRRSMRSVAGYAALYLDRRMLVHKRPGLFCVALKAHRILRGSGPQLARQESAMRIMAIAALHEPFVNTMVKSARELLLCFEMAAVAKLWLPLFH